MPRAKELEPTAGLFESKSQEKRIARILDKAVEKRIRASARSVPKTKIRLPGGAGRKAQKSILGAALAAALGVRKGGRNKPSLRMKAPDTGSRSFHFEHTTVTKGQAYKASTNAKGGKSTKGMGTAAAHLSYIERETAVEKLQRIEERGWERELDVELLLDGPAIDLPKKRGRPSREDLRAREIIEEARGRDREIARERAEALGRDPSDIGPTLEGQGKAGAAQTYIEDPAKMRNGEIILSSFGTIGETYEERLRFWSLVEEHEWAPDARVQNRIICELPHQSTPEARNAILKDFVKVFDEKEIPYHVAVHAPGAKNDSRNFHAHIVFLERPAKKMVDPKTGELEWDFAITETYRTSSRNTKTSHPHRRSRDRDLNKKTFVADMRKRFATSVNDVMAKIDKTVKFDHRSYEAMGLNVDPMKSVYRITHDRMNDGKLVIQDVEWTRRMVAVKMREAAVKRDPDMIRLQQTARELEGLKKAWPNVGSMNRLLGVNSKIVTIGTMTRKTFVQMVNHRLALETARLEQKVVSKAELELCREVMEATRPPKLKGPKHQDLRTPEQQEELRVLFETAKEEYDAVSARMKSETFRLNGMIALNRQAWRTTAKTLIVPPKVAPVPLLPEKPDPRTGKVMFEPELAAKAGRQEQDAAKARRPQAPPATPGVAPQAATPKPAGQGPTRPAAQAGQPEAATAKAPRAARPMAMPGVPPVAPEQSSEPAIDPKALERAIASQMATMTKDLLSQGTAFDKDAFWADYARNPPSQKAMAVIESIMKLPQGSLQAGKGPLAHLAAAAEQRATVASRKAAPEPIRNAQGATPSNGINAAGALTETGLVTAPTTEATPTITAINTKSVAAKLPTVDAEKSAAATATRTPTTNSALTTSDERARPIPTWDFGLADSERSVSTPAAPTVPGETDARKVSNECAPAQPAQSQASAAALLKVQRLERNQQSIRCAAAPDTQRASALERPQILTGEAREPFTSPSAEHGQRIIAAALKALEEKHLIHAKEPSAAPARPLNKTPSAIEGIFRTVGEGELKPTTSSLERGQHEEQIAKTLTQRHSAAATVDAAPVRECIPQPTQTDEGMHAPAAEPNPPKNPASATAVVGDVPVTETDDEKRRHKKAQARRIAIQRQNDKKGRE